jgi:hypothetical protein
LALALCAAACKEELPLVRVTELRCDGDRNGDGFLSASENTGTDSDAFRMTCTVSFSDEAANGLEVFVLTNEPAVTRAGLGIARGRSASVPVSLRATTRPLRHELTVALRARLTPESAAATYQAIVDLVPPGVAIVQPGPGNLLAANDRDPATEEVLDCCLRGGGDDSITAAVGDATGMATLRVDSAVRAEKAIANGLVQFYGIGLAQGSHSLTVEASDAAGNRGTSQPLTVFVDSIPPKIRITSGTTSTGSIVTVTFEYRDVEPARPIVLRDAGVAIASAVTAAGDPTSLRTGSVQVSLANGVHPLQAETTDVNGNVGRSPVVVVTVGDTTAPAVPTFTAVRGPGRGRASLQWVMPGDDGTTGRVASYDIRVRVCDPGQACPVTTAEFDNPALTFSLPNLPPIADGGTSMELAADNLALEKELTFAIRARDAAGNDSAIVAAPFSTVFASETLAGPGGELFYGYSMASADVDGDGRGDLIVGRLGLANGGVRVIRAADPESPADIAGTEPGEFMGFAVENAGDLDRDGFEDVLVGAIGASGGGKAYLFFGSADGLEVNQGGSPIVLTPPGGANVGSYGQSLAGLGDLRGTGSPHIAVGAADFLVLNPTRPGKVFLYEVQGSRPNRTASLVATLVGEANEDHFGSSVCGTGDATGDGVPDLVVGASRESAQDGQGNYLNGRAYVLYGGATVAGMVTFPPAGGIRMARIEDQSQLRPDWFGTSCASAGNLDGSGPNDLVIGAPGAGAQRVYVYRGRADLDSAPPALPDVVLHHPSFVFPAELSAGRDLDGDGLPDVIVGDQAGAFLFRGDPSGIARPAPSAVFVLPSDPQKAHAVAVIGNWADAFPGEDLPDVAFANPPGPSVLVRH